MASQEPDPFVFDDARREGDRGEGRRQRRQLGMHHPVRQGLHEQHDDGRDRMTPPASQLRSTVVRSRSERAKDNAVNPTNKAIVVGVEPIAKA